MKKILLPFLAVVLITSCNQPTTNTPAANETATPVQETAFKPANVNEQAIYSRAFNTVLWGMPAVN